MKSKLKIYYNNIKKRVGLERQKIEEYHVVFKFDTEKEREDFKEGVKKWYNADEDKKPVKKTTTRKKATGKNV